MSCAWHSVLLQCSSIRQFQTLNLLDRFKKYWISFCVLRNTQFTFLQEKPFFDHSSLYWNCQSVFAYPRKNSLKPTKEQYRDKDALTLSFERYSRTRDYRFKGVGITFNTFLMIYYFLVELYKHYLIDPCAKVIIFFVF